MPNLMKAYTDDPVEAWHGEAGVTLVLTHPLLRARNLLER